jgi:hypothetical protein
MICQKFKQNKQTPGAIMTAILIPDFPDRIDHLAALHPR